MSDISTLSHQEIEIEGTRKARGNLTKGRIIIVMSGLLLLFAIIVARLIFFGNSEVVQNISGQERDLATASRPAILDRNGVEMAIDIRMPSLFAEPNRIIDVEEAVRKLRTQLPNIDEDWLRKRLTGDKGFVWVARELTPRQQRDIFRLGIPGIDFRIESKRFYPSGNDVSHLMGAVNRDNQGIAGFERYLDEKDIAILQEIGLARGRKLEPVIMSIDMRVQHAMHSVLSDAMERYNSIAAAGVLMDVNTGEVIALVSLPDFDPNIPSSALEPYEGVKGARINRITAGKFEMGSVFKAISFAAALDSGSVKITDSFDATKGVKFGRFTIGDFHGKKRILSVPEIFKYSSNIGTIKMMQAMGKDNYRAFLTKIGFDDELSIELPEITTSTILKNFSEVGAATASFGHGLSITPLHMAAGVSAIVNGGNYIPPTLYKRNVLEASSLYRPIISAKTSDKMRYLFRLNALEGSARLSNKIANGYRFGGKTGTAEKVVNGRYNSDLTFATFVSAFPLENPKYAMVVLIDEPKKENQRSGTTAGYNAGMTSGRIVKRIAPMLGIKPDFDVNIDAKLLPAELR
jgi:cell division protein FtsI (penicillin-binding protein 3)